MILYIIALLVLSLWRIRWSTTVNPFDREMTTCVNGLFVLLVVLSHTWSIALAGCECTMLDSLYRMFQVRFMGQLIVVPFLFYSGFGVMEQIKRKGTDYLDSFPWKRIAPLYLNYCVAVLVFAGFAYISGVRIPLKIFLLSFTCWDRIDICDGYGHPTWYVFCILYCYMGHWLVCKMFDVSKRIRIILALAGLIGVYASVVFAVRHEPWWVNTVFCYWLGVVCSLYKNRIEAVVRTCGWGLFAFPCCCGAVRASWASL